MIKNLPQQNIPSGWGSKVLSSLTVIKKGEQLNRLAMSDVGEYPAMNGGIRPSGYTDRWNTEKNTITISEGGNSCGFVNFNTERFWCGGHCYALLNIDNNLDTNFLYQFLKSKQSQIMKLRVGSGLPNIQKKSIEEFSVVFPKSKTEQQKIAEILGTVDEDIAKTQEVIEATEKLKRGLMQRLFTHGIGHTKFKETKIGQIPELWNMIPVSEVVNKIIDNRGKTPPLSPDGVGMIEVNAIDSSQKYPNYSRVSKNVSQETYDSWFRSGHPEKGDILIPTVGTVGVAVIMNENKGCIAQNIIAVRVKDIILPDFFYYLVVSPLFVDQIKKVLMGAVQPSLKVPHMLAFNIPLPIKPEQKEIAEILSAIDEKIFVNKELKEKLTLLKKGLMQDLLSGKVRTNI